MVSDKLMVVLDHSQFYQESSTPLGKTSMPSSIRALAVGAKMVLIGRPYMYGLALVGEEGVSHVLKCLLGDSELTLHLVGIPGVESRYLNRDVLVREDQL
ncbi:hypothetical protein AC579_7963 [Pseudocercospora musae]|uniref:FMN-dependent dehydrogenase domain-containing protein n=1 Tax=Pseudocercospora musae TaxID=113226 RepID=A0A139H6G4_9PEZI|nr:hypothetical protein AC579_7963 [Pseudocercospora musae]